MPAAPGPRAPLSRRHWLISVAVEPSWRAPGPPTTQPLPLTGRLFSRHFRKSRTIWRVCATSPKRRGSSRKPYVAATQSLSLENDRYKAGTDSYLNVITTQTILLTDQQNAITILQRRMSAAVDLIKALGGGWDASTLPSGAALRSIPPADPPVRQ